MLAIAALLVLAPAPLPQGFAFDAEADFRGTVTSVGSSLAAPLDGVAVGDPVLLHLDFLLNDYSCTAPSGLDGDVLNPSLCSLEVAGASAAFDPLSEPCTFERQWQQGLGTIRCDIDADLASGIGSLAIVLDDPNGAVGVSAYELATHALDVAGVTDPLFSITFEVHDPSGALAFTVDVERIDGLLYGNSICQVEPNSTGSPTRIYLRGSPIAADNDLTLGANDLPPSSFVYFLTSQTPGFVANPNGSAGNLCVLGDIGRFVGPGQILATGTGGPVELPIDLTALPQPMGTASVSPGDVWYFTCWYRDIVGSTTNNFGATVRVQFY